MANPPVPGPSGLHSILKAASSVPVPAVVPAELGFRELAKHHARAASQLAEDADDALAKNSPGWDDLAGLAETHALVALACSSVAPVARRRLEPCKAGAK